MPSKVFIKTEQHIKTDQKPSFQKQCGITNHLPNVSDKLVSSVLNDCLLSKKELSTRDSHMVPGVFYMGIQGYISFKDALRSVPI